MKKQKKYKNITLERGLIGYLNGGGDYVLILDHQTNRVSCDRVISLSSTAVGWYDEEYDQTSMGWADWPSNHPRITRDMVMDFIFSRLPDGYLRVRD